MRYHDRKKCEGYNCPFHSPSDHHMVRWPLVLRETGLMERTCKHGVGHPDPDSLAYFDRVQMARDGTHTYMGVHGCDGCCLPPQVQDAQKVADDAIEPKLTLETWAALDQAASPGPWSAVPERDGTLHRVLVTGPCETNGPEACLPEDARFCAASRQAPTRLLAALRGLAREWDEKESQHASSDYGKACAYEACAAQLRHLIATNDLAATATCQHNFQANYGLYDTSHRYCTKCGVAE